MNINKLILSDTLAWLIICKFTNGLFSIDTILLCRYQELPLTKQCQNLSLISFKHFTILRGHPEPRLNPENNDIKRHKMGRNIFPLNENYPCSPVTPLRGKDAYRLMMFSLPACCCLTWVFSFFENLHLYTPSTSPMGLLPTTRA